MIEDCSGVVSGNYMLWIITVVVFVAFLCYISTGLEHVIEKIFRVKKIGLHSKA